MSRDIVDEFTKWDVPLALEIENIFARVLLINYNFLRMIGIFGSLHQNGDKKSIIFHCR